MRVFALLALCLAAVSAVPSNPQRIVGGSVTTISQYPTIASLLYRRSGFYIQSCGGVILNNRAVLTAAHCPFGDAVSTWQIRLGSTNANSGGDVYHLNRIIIHPNFNRFTMDNDIAIMRTHTTISFKNNVRAASIAGSNYNLGDGQVVWAAGWGRTSHNGPVSEQLRHVQVWTVNQNTCRSRYATVRYTITNNMLCSGWLDVGGRDQCQGDSGGPLYHNGVVVGVSSFGQGCGLAAYPGVNTRVSRFASWVQSNA